MKRIIIIPMMFLQIYCTVMSCAQETDQSQCQKHTMESEYNYLSCFKIENNIDDNQCTPFFTDKTLQKAYINYMSGYEKEWLSIYPLSEVGENTIETFDKENYNTNEIIKYKNVPLTEKEKRIINNNNTCMYQSFARFVDPDHYIGERKINISNESVCHNVDRFDDLKDILDCNIATIEGKYKNEPFIFSNCYNFLDTNADEKFKNYYKEFYLKPFFQQYYNDIIKTFINKIAPYADIYSKSKKRQLQNQDIQDFKMTIKDRHGNIIVFNQDGDIISGDEPTKFLSSRTNSLNFLLLLCFVLFLR